jgi:predicted membrane chloride channel (bestrophin family)
MTDFTYHPSHYGIIQILFKWKGTVLSQVFGHPGWWTFWIAHLTLWYGYNWGFLAKYREKTKEDSVLEVKWTDIGIITSLTIFFEVFYTNECYQCYMQLNTLVNMSFRSSHRFFLAVETYFREADPGIRRLIMRYERCILIMFFMEIRHGPLHPGQWELIVRDQLLKPAEAAFLREYSGAQRSMIVWGWLGRLIEYGYESMGDNKHTHGRKQSVIQPKSHASVLRSLIDKLDEVEEAQKKVLDVVRMPVPFQYFHLLNVMISVNVSLWAYAMAMSESLLAPISFFFASLIFIGMLELAKDLSDPFGGDEVDFPLHIWVQKFMENQLILENCDYLGEFTNIARIIREEAAVNVNYDGLGKLIETEPDLLNHLIAAEGSRSIRSQ